ncbi:MAG TPA: hypothetical protein VGH19_04330 [Verrucomicrobiae bacterium]
MSPSFKDFLKNLALLALFAFFLLPGIVMIIDSRLYITEIRSSKGAKGMENPFLFIPVIGLLGIVLIRKDLLRSFREWKRLGYPTRKHRSTNKET